MESLYSYRSNRNRTQDPDTRTAQGDFPEKIQTLATRDDFLEEQIIPEGDIKEGVSMTHDLYRPEVVVADPLEPTTLS